MLSTLFVAWVCLACQIIAAKAMINARNATKTLARAIRSPVDKLPANYSCKVGGARPPALMHARRAGVLAQRMWTNSVRMRARPLKEASDNHRLSIVLAFFDHILASHTVVWRYPTENCGLPPRCA